MSNQAQLERIKMAEFINLTRKSSYNVRTGVRKPGIDEAIGKVSEFVIAFIFALAIVWFI